MNEHCGGEPLVIHWRVDRQLFSTVEIPLSDAESFLVPLLTAVEVRPGVGLLSIGLLRYIPGNFYPDSPGFHELMAAVHVHPDLSVAMPAPRFSLFATTVSSDSPDFVAQEGEFLWTPTELRRLEVAWEPDCSGADVSDEDGPILRLRSGVPPTFGATRFFGQHFTLREGQLMRGAWDWEGVRFEHQRRTSDNQLYPHPFWKGRAWAGPKRCYTQMVSLPTDVHHKRFYRMVAVGGRAGSGV